jgi:hypothetical protein
MEKPAAIMVNELSSKGHTINRGHHKLRKTALYHWNDKPEHDGNLGAKILVSGPR